MSEKKKFDFKELAQMDIKDLFKKKTPAKVKEKKSKPMLKPVVSFDFGSESIKVVEGRYIREQLQVTNCFSVTTPQGAIEDGRIVNVSLLVTALSKALSDHGVKAKDAIGCLNSTQIINRELLIPVVASDEMETVVRYEIQQFLPINLSDYLIQYVILSEVEVMGEKRLKLNVITFPEKMARSYYDLLKELGFKPYALDVSYNAISKLATYSDLLEQVTTAEGTVAFVDMGAQSIDLNIFTDENIQFTRLIKSGGAIIDEKLNQLPDMSIKSAVSLKQEADLREIGSSNLVQRAIILSIDEMLYELERVLQFYRNKAVGNTIDHVYLLGGLSHLKGLETYMENRLNTPVSKLKDISLTDVNQALTPDVLGDYANALGAMIRF
ncbi:type IV pilus assembly protein PilM [Turicibacter sanguinis]|uniref:type IV pilus assembly protein PilM n=1 Tax=Turicibacter sanguinis TaxID=154288 RepID=UPI0006C452E2|nr:type IV pilus assembly protein PilM [Turicibacter sanguinis]MDB8540389.1 type IV pilus assembly protein PilM [Turicibacter sanguinis]MDB8575243.1 type IV pilus assembly protein PilM [Turicibacter sanguinis]MDB8578251.1 type IV pilus assembly protein PilM [Turicibacter sanguinis]MDB8583760.1 type IV pilus assembly protein PilM [Turicibacter sanguinis]MDB8586544.1 type IV pilus assembly protein PilM [Turicibacter sanguinis]